MSRVVSAGRAAGAVGAAVGVAALGAAIGFAAERYVVGRSLRRDDPYADEKFGSLRGSSVGNWPAGPGWCSGTSARTVDLGAHRRAVSRLNGWVATLPT